MAAVGGIAVAGAAITKFGFDSLQAAKESEEAMARVRKNVENAGHSYETYADQLDKVGQAAARKGFDDEAAMESATQLAQKNKDVAEGIKLQALAMDVARGRNMSLEAATQLVIKAQMGQSGALRRLGIDMEKGATSQQMLGALQQRYAGQADAYSKTQAGAADRLKVSWENFQESVGEKLIPIVAKLMQKLADFSDWLSENWPRIWANVKDRAEPVLKWLWPFVRRIFDNVKNAIELVVNILQGDWSDAWGNIKKIVQNAIANLGQLAGLAGRTGLALGKAIGKAFGNALIEMVEWAMNKAIDGINGPGKLLNKLIPGGDPIPSVGHVRLPRIGGSNTGDIGKGVNSAFMASGGVIAGDPAAGDSVPAVLTPGEVVLNKRQQAILGADRIMQVLAATGGKIGGGRFASGGLVNPFPGGSWAGSPRDHGARALGNWQSDNAWDIMGRSGAPVYAVASGLVTRISASGKHPQFAGQGVYLQTGSGTWWYKHITSSVRAGQRVNAGDLIGTLVGWTQGGPHLHLARDRGDPAAARGGMAPGGSTGAAAGSGGGSTAASAAAQKAAAQKDAADKKAAAQKAAVTKAVAAALKGISYSERDGMSSSPSGGAASNISAAVTAAGRAAMAAGQTPEQIREAMDDRQRNLEIAWVKKEITSAVAEMRKVSGAITKVRARLKQARKALGKARAVKGRGRGPAVQKAYSVVLALAKKEQELLEAQSGVREWLTDLRSRALELDIAAQEDALEGQDTSTTDATDTSTPDPDLQAITDQATRRAEVAQAGQLAGDQFIRAALGPGDLSQGGMAAWLAAGGTMNVNVQTLHPGDPNTLQAIIEAIARAANQSPATMAPGEVLTV